MNNQVRHLALLCCSLPLLAAACGGESPTEGSRVGPYVPLVPLGSLLKVSGDGQVARLGHPLSRPLQIQVVDTSGNGLPGVRVTWSVSSLRVSSLGMLIPVIPVGTVTEDLDFGGVSEGRVVTDSAGLATALWTLGGLTGQNQQTATEQTATASSDLGSATFTATTPSLVPLTDMGDSTYFGFPGGLYSGGNVMPQAHADAGRAFAAAVEPLDTNGDPDPDGKYVLLDIGHSNTELVFCDAGALDMILLCPSYSFTGQAMADPDVDKTNLALVRGGCCGGEASLMQSPGDGDYERLLTRLSIEGLSEQQVQVVWAQLGAAVPITLPQRDAGAHRMVRWMGNVMGAFRSRYPNLRLVFFTSDVFGGYADREPVHYEYGFAMKWLIQAQIDQMANGGTIVDVRAGDLNYNTAVPWIAWGPYLWADGVNARSDGILWGREDYDDPVHLDPGGVKKAAGLLLTFFKTSPQARCWFVAGETC